LPISRRRSREWEGGQPVRRDETRPPCCPSPELRCREERNRRRKGCCRKRYSATPLTSGSVRGRVASSERSFRATRVSRATAVPSPRSFARACPPAPRRQVQASPAAASAPDNATRWLQRRLLVEASSEE